MKNLKTQIVFFFLLICFSAFSQSQRTHVVKKGETLYSISRMYGLKPQQLAEYNNIEGLTISIDQVLKIPPVEGVSSTPKEQSKTSAPISYGSKTHIVKPKETIYGISKMYGVSQDDLKKANPQIAVSGLQINMELIIPSSSASMDTKPEPAKKEIAATENKPYEKPSQSPQEPVKVPSEQKTKTSVPIAATPVVNTNQIGDTLVKIEELNIAKKEIEQNHVDSKYVSSTSFSPQREIKVAFMLPLFLDENDSLAFSSEKSQVKDASIPGLSFYMGAKMALDSLEKIGVQASVKILDTKRSSDRIDRYVLTENFEQYDVIIGPLYAEVAEHMARKVGGETLILSPFSVKHKIDRERNLIQATTPNNSLDTLMYNHVIKTIMPEDNIIMLSKESTLNPMFQKLRNKLVEMNFKVNHINSDLSALYERVNLKMDTIKHNIIIVSNLDSELMSELSSVAEGKKDETRMKVVCFDLDTRTKRYISDKKLVSAEKMNLTFPERLFESRSNKALDLFTRKYKNKYKEIPNTYALQGFDITMDIFMRFSSSDKSKEALLKQPTQGLVSRYNYMYNTSGSYNNKDGFILQHRRGAKVEKLN